MESIGEPGRDWLDALPAMLARRRQAWRLSFGARLTGGIGSYVCRVTTAGGEPAVLKLALPGPWLDAQIATLLAADGRGYARVLDHDVVDGAILLEALGEPLDETTVDVPAALDVIGRTLLEAWSLPSSDWPVPTEEEHKAAGLLRLVTRLAVEAGGAGRAVDRAGRYAEERLGARDLSREVVVHGDPHPGNLLRVVRPRPGAASGFVFVDPDGFRCAPEYDAGVALRDWNHQLVSSADPAATLAGWCARLARITALDSRAIWQWAFLERVSTGLYLIDHGMSHLGRPFLEVATRLLAHER
jgi:streptomycin 6-kinase